MSLLIRAVWRHKPGCGEQISVILLPPPRESARSATVIAGECYWLLRGRAQFRVQLDPCSALLSVSPPAEDERYVEDADRLWTGVCPRPPLRRSQGGSPYTTPGLSVVASRRPNVFNFLIKSILSRSVMSSGSNAATVAVIVSPPCIPCPFPRPAPLPPAPHQPRRVRSSGSTDRLSPRTGSTSTTSPTWRTAAPPHASAVRTSTRRSPGTRISNALAQTLCAASFDGHTCHTHRDRGPVHSGAPFGSPARAFLRSSLLARRHGRAWPLGLLQQQQLQLPLHQRRLPMLARAIPTGAELVDVHRTGLSH